MFAATNGLCTAYNTVQVVVNTEEVDLEVPNGFSPNNDGINDFFVIVDWNNMARTTSLSSTDGEMKSIDQLLT